MADDFRPGEDDRITQRDYPEPERYGRRGRRIMTALMAVAAVLGFGVVLVYAYNKGKQDGESNVPPVIQAQDGPTKIRPESPGGMKVPDRDKEVFSRLEIDKRTDRVERLLPAPEKPMTPPAQSPAVPPEVTKMAPAAGPATGTSATGPMPSKKAVSAAVKAPKIPPPPLVINKPLTRPKPLASKTPKLVKSGRFRVQILSLRSRADVLKSWKSLQQRHSNLLGKLALNIEPVRLSGGRGTYYRMQAGALASRAQATALCGKLKQRKLSCIVVKR
jgi:hypothetical protein